MDEIVKNKGSNEVTLKQNGRPSLYAASYDEQVYKLCLLGATDKDIADFFDVTEQTVNNWKNNYPSFFESIKKGKSEADANVAKSLYQRAIGYEHPEDKIFNDNGEPMIVPTIKHYPPEPVASIFWLKNRQPQLWRDKQETVLTGPNGGPIQAQAVPFSYQDFANLSPDERQKIEEAARIMESLKNK